MYPYIPSIQDADCFMLLISNIWDKIKVIRMQPKIIKPHSRRERSMHLHTHKEDLELIPLDNKLAQQEVLTISNP